MRFYVYGFQWFIIIIIAYSESDRDGRAFPMPGSDIKVDNLCI